MVVGLGHVALRIEGCRSLKEKRRIVKAVIHRLRNEFNVSAAEVGANDIHQRAEIGVAAVRPAEFIILRFSHKMQEA